MKRVILVSDNEKLIEFCGVVLEGQLNINLEVKASGSDYFGDPSKAGEIFAIISDLDIFHSENGMFLYSSNKEFYQIPFFLILNSSVEDIEGQLKLFFQENKHNTAISIGDISKRLLVSLKQVISKMEMEAHFKLNSEEHKGVKLYRVKAAYFLNAIKAEGDVFVKLKTGKFIKLIKAGDEVHKETIQNIIKKGQQYLYQDATAYENFVGTKLSSLKKGLTVKDLDDSKKIQLQLASIKEVQSAVRMMGISEVSIQLTDEVVESVEDVIKGKKALQTLVRNMLKFKSTFFTRSSILNYLLGGLASKIGWDTKSSLKKLIFASVFCDYAFNEEQEDLAVILSLQSEVGEALSSYEKKIIEKHPEIAAVHLEATQSMLLDETLIIRQHHEKPDGTGFPKGLTSKNIAPMSCAFILCYDFVQTLVENCKTPEEIDCQKIFDILGDDYKTGNFEKPYHALRKALRLDI
jgi:hypothetical protein